MATACRANAYPQLQSKHSPEAGTHVHIVPGSPPPGLQLGYARQREMISVPAFVAQLVVIAAYGQERSGRLAKVSTIWVTAVL